MASQREERNERILAHMPAIQRAVELALDFGARPLGMTEEPGELGVGTPVKSLGDIVHNRVRRSIDLIL